METTFIYSLNDPETGECRYVGKANDPHGRLFGGSGHLKTCYKTKTHCANWIKSLVARRLTPLLEILDEVPRIDWKLWEQAWIKASREIGMDLTNLTAGGNGTNNLSAETRAKIGAVHCGKKLSTEHRAKISARLLGNKNMLGKKYSLETRAKMSASLLGNKNMLGKKHSAETCAKMSAARLGNTYMLGKKHSLETRAKMSATHLRKNRVSSTAV